MGYCSKYHFNSLGSIMSLTDSSGDIKERYSYNVYGEPTVWNASGTEISSSQVMNPYMFTGRRWDDGIELYHYRARAYNPSSGRFLQRDPVPSYSLYAYVANSPVSWIDPYGAEKKRTEEVTVNLHSESPGFDAVEDLSWFFTGIGVDFCVTSIENAKEQVEKYFESEKGKCLCISKLAIRGHGNTGFFSVGSPKKEPKKKKKKKASDPDDWDKHYIGTFLFYSQGKPYIHDSVSKYEPYLKGIAKYFCEKNREVLLTACCTAAGPLGRETISKLSKIFDADITASKGIVRALGGWGDWVTLKRGASPDWTTDIPEGCSGGPGDPKKSKKK